MTNINISSSFSINTSAKHKKEVFIDKTLVAKINELRGKGDTYAAIDACTQALHKDPYNVVANHLCGKIHLELQQAERSLPYLEAALSTLPKLSEISKDLGIAKSLLKLDDEAIEYYKAALAYQPNDIESLCKISISYISTGRLDEAAQSTSLCLELQPDLLEAQCIQAMILQGSLEHEKAIQLFTDVCSKNSSAMFLRPYIRALDYAPKQQNKTVFDAIKKLGMEISSATSEKINPVIQKTFKYRIGYLSSDLYTHSVVYFLESILKHHSHDFEVFLYSAGDIYDDTSERLKTMCHSFTSLKGVSAHDSALRIAQDNLQVLFDLDGHIHQKTPYILSFRPAPIQIAWIGYPNTSGLPEIDYRITDNITDPAGIADDYHTETLIRLEKNFSAYTPPRKNIALAGLPYDRNNYITFGSFNECIKLNKEVVDCWSKILNDVPKSKLLLKLRNIEQESMRAVIVGAFESNGISSDRLILRGRALDQADHFRQYNDMDIALDTFPFNGATTTCEALWMSVPVITLKGESHVARVGASQLFHVGHPELVGKSSEEYISIASNLAHDLSRLRELRSNIRNEFLNSPQTDGKALTLNIEDTLKELIGEKISNI